MTDLVSVPRTPTKEMYDAAIDVWYRMNFGEKPKTSHTWQAPSAAFFAQIYKAMIDAAP